MVSALVYVMHIGYGESLRKAINCHDSSSYYTKILSLERILSLCQNQQETLTYG